MRTPSCCTLSAMPTAAPMASTSMAAMSGGSSTPKYVRACVRARARARAYVRALPVLRMRTHPLALHHVGIDAFQLSVSVAKPHAVMHFSYRCRWPWRRQLCISVIGDGGHGDWLARHRTSIRWALLVARMFGHRHRAMCRGGCQFEVRGGERGVASLSPHHREHDHASSSGQF